MCGDLHVLRQLQTARALTLERWQLAGHDRPAMNLTTADVPMIVRLIRQTLMTRVSKRPHDRAATNGGVAGESSSASDLGAEESIMNRRVLWQRSHERTSADLLELAAHKASATAKSKLTKVTHGSMSSSKSVLQPAKAATASPIGQLVDPPTHFLI